MESGMAFEAVANELGRVHHDVVSCCEGVAVDHFPVLAVKVQ